MSLTVWSWRQAIERAELKPMTKLVLYTLANYMNEHGQGCYPSIPVIAKATGLQERSIYNHIKDSEQAGFLERKKRKLSGQEWASNEYVATYPKEVHPDAGLHSDASQEVHVDAVKGCTQVHTNSPLISPSDVIKRERASQANEILTWLQEHFGRKHFYNFAPVVAWLEWGADFELDIKPTATSYTLRKQDPPRSLKWLDEMIAASIKTRNNPMPEGNAPNGLKVQSNEDAWMEKWAAK